MANFDALGFNAGKLKKVGSGDNLQSAGGLVIKDGGTIGSASASTAITIANTGNVSLSNDLTVTGSLNVSGANNVISATNVQYEDTLLELGMEDNGSGGVQAPTTQTVKDIGLIFHLHDGTSAAKDALFFDATNGEYYLHSGVTETNGVLSNGTAATLHAIFAGDLTGDVTGDVTGNLTGNASGTAGSLASAQNFSITGDVSASAVSFNGTGAVALSSVLATVNSDVGSYGSTTAVPVITVNGKGLVTAVTTASISTSFDIAADNGSNDTVAGGETLTISGTANQLETTVSNNNITIDFVDSPTIGGGANSTVTIDADLEVNDGFNIVNKIPLSTGTVSTGDFVTVTLTKATGNGSMIIGMHVGGANSGTAELAVNGTTVKGFDLSSYSAGNQLFLSGSGTMTTSAPTTGEIIQVGYVLTAANPGQMYVDVKHIMSN